MAWLITGGAGYIGAHVVRDMLAAGREVVVLDDLSTGRADRLPARVPLIKGSITNRRAVRRALQHESGVTGVMHFAARKQVGESVQRPLHYWGENVGGLQVVLEEMVEAGVDQMVFSSSAAVYGQPDLPDPLDRITETTPCAPINPYGATKLAGEWMVAATAAAHGWKALSLRYFNVAGAGSPDLGDPAALNLIPMVLAALDAGRRPLVFGDDYDTPDGSCVRDYIHVADLSAAHVAAARVVEAAHAGAVVRSPQEKLQQAAARAEQAATRLPGGALAVEVANQVPAAAEAAAALAMGRVPPAVRAVERATGALPWALRPSGAGGVTGQAGEIVAEVASQLGSLAAKVVGVEEAPRLVDHLAVNVGTGRGSSVFEVIEALRASVGDDFAVDIVERRAGDPPALVAAADRALALLGWRAKHGLRDMTDSAWAAWQVRPGR
ncbi:MAG: NAD-dependent epimerase/dehydratase family protein [Candidatus Nanopelagicales bacterium]|jgi:UDP-glucose 4-epimerase|nr:NAD-dependent epimerase/dehydratase family protein [Candidatus Nanopelagicales bacterium]